MRHISRILIGFSLFSGAIASAAANDYDSVYLWPDGAPGAVGEEEKDKPRLTIHLADGADATGAAVVVFPGGGYRALAADHEGLQVANFLNANGISAFVLRYRLLPDYEPSVSLQDAQRAIRYVRHNAEHYDIAPDRIGILGFSAGGHLTTAAATADCAGNADAADPVDKESARPDFAVPIYAVTSRDLLKFEMGDYATTPDLVTPDTPPSFLVHTHEDTVVVPQNSIRFYEALLANGVPAEMHIFQRGPHGLGLAPQDPSMGAWPSMLVGWLQRGGWLTDAPDVAVSGHVLVDGEPMFWGAVTFEPLDKRLRTGIAGVDRSKDGGFQTSDSNVLSEGRYNVIVHRFANSWSDAKLGEYSLDGADRWELPDPIDVREGMDPLEIVLESKQ